MILHVLIAMVAGWLQRHQQQVIAYLQEENRGLDHGIGHPNPHDQSASHWNDTHRVGVIWIPF
jgi:hypothetical protein